MLVGTAILAGRQTIPDMPGVLPVPGATTAAANAAASTLPAGAYFLVLTFRNQWGETTGNTETTVTTSGGNLSISISAPGSIPIGATTLRVYLTLAGGVAGTEQQFVEFTGTGPYVISAPPASAGIPPTRNTCWLPDSDGTFISAGAIYNWLNEGLHMISQQTDGILDYCAVGSVQNQPLYTLPGQWFSITSVWYDGYWMTGGDRGMFFRRNSITSQILSSATLSVDGNRNVLEVYPQPARTAVSTTLGASMGLADTTATLTSNPGFVLPFGFAGIDVAPNYEIVAYATINTTPAMTGLIRGLGGTIAVTHANGVVVNELNLAFNGKRIVNASYVPGQATVDIPVPLGWTNLLLHYLSGRAKLVEHDGQSYSQFMQEMRLEIKEWAQSNRGVMKRRQIGGNAMPATYYGDIAGGIILP